MIKISEIVKMSCFALSLINAAYSEDIVRLGNLKFAHYGAISYMKEIGTKYTIRFEEKMFAKGIDINPAIIAGKIDVSASAADAAVAGKAQGVPIVIVAGFARGGARIVVQPGISIKTLADLKGRKIGVTRGGAQELLLLAELSKVNLTWSDKGGKDVQILYLPFPDLNQALLQKQIDAMCQSEPYSSQALSKGFGVELLKPYDTPLGEPVRTLVMTEELYKQKDLALRIMKCFLEATKKFIDEPQFAENYVREHMFKGQLTSSDYQNAIRNSPFTYDISTEHIQITTDLMMEYGVGKMSKPPKASDWVKLDLLTKAKAELNIQ